MKITKENIEYFIFEYHEGNLSDTDKAEVLNFIHQHPEYENDFTHWAQSYFHTEGSVQNYGITNQLLQKNPLSGGYNNKWFAVSSGIVVFAVGLYSYLLIISNQKTTSVTAPAVHSTSVKESEKKETSKSQTSITQTLQDENHAAQNNTATQSLTSELPENILAGSTADTLLQTNNENTSASAIDDKPNSISKTDTIQQTTSVTQNNTQVKNRKTPAKNKSGISLKPENKFIPTNPDF